MVIGTHEDEILKRIVLCLRVLYCMVDLEGTAANPISAEATDAIGGVENGIDNPVRDRCPVNPLLDESYVGLTVIRLEHFLRYGAERTDGMPMCLNSRDQIRIESDTEERSVGSDIHSVSKIHAPQSACRLTVRNGSHLI